MSNDEVVKGGEGCGGIGRAGGVDGGRGGRSHGKTLVIIALIDCYHVRFYICVELCDCLTSIRWRLFHLLKSLLQDDQSITRDIYNWENYWLLKMSSIYT